MTHLKSCIKEQEQEGRRKMNFKDEKSHGRKDDSGCACISVSTCEIVIETLSVPLPVPRGVIPARVLLETVSVRRHSHASDSNTGATDIVLAHIQKQRSMPRDVWRSTSSQKLRWMDRWV